MNTPRRPISFQFGTASANGDTELGRPRLGIDYDAAVGSPPGYMTAEEIQRASVAEAHAAGERFGRRWLSWIPLAIFAAALLVAVGAAASIAVHLVELGWGAWP